MNKNVGSKATSSKLLVSLFVLMYCTLFYTWKTKKSGSGSFQGPGNPAPRHPPTQTYSPDTNGRPESGGPEREISGISSRGFPPEFYYYFSFFRERGREKKRKWNLGKGTFWQVAHLRKIIHGK